MISYKTASDPKYSKHKEVRDVGYATYDNFDAIEVPFTDAIPSDYDGAMGVPITFLNKHNPDQFEILGSFNAGGASPHQAARQQRKNHHR